jgi:hypothetical protein
MIATKQAAPQRPGTRADRLRRARRMAYLGCAAALGYGVLKLDWALGGTVGLRDPAQFRDVTLPGSTLPANLTAPQLWLDNWATPILAGLAVVILLGLVYPWGNVPIVRPLLRALAWAGSLMALAGVGEFVQTIRYYAGDLPRNWMDGMYPAIGLYVGVCFLVLGVAFGVTAWLTRR